MSATHCSRCGRSLADPACCVRSADPVAYDRDGDALWEGAPARYCPDCGERLLAGPHACPPRVIRFYGVGGSYGAFSNFAPYELVIEGRRYPTSEHYFQAQKFAGSAYAETIRGAVTPATAARLGRSRRHKLRSDWEAVKREVMLVALRAKFSQHPALSTLLLETGDARLVEHTPRDRYWGDGGDGSGKNWLGRLLERVREELGAASLS